MYSIAVCDDDLDLCKIIKTVIEDYEELYNIQFRIDIYNSGYELYMALKEGKLYDTIFLDVCMEGVDGLNIGDFIREASGNLETNIIYLSVEKEMALNLFKYRPVDFLVKPLNRKKIISSLDKSISTYLKKDKFFSYEFNKSKYKISCSNIMYISSKLRKLSLHTTNGELEFYGKMSDIADKLPKEDFIRIHKSYIVNLKFIENVTHTYLKLANNTKLNISLPYREEVKKRLLDN